ncbi:MAG TPA: DUF4255 domain-containing protein [Symbiobacteriaceae bacterium]|nr:DUF4255 domain-containing protein [Symbiobacteriaceae bacterium]
MPDPQPYQVIRDATDSLFKVLDAATVTGGLLDGVRLDVATPYDSYTPSFPTVTLWLYRVAENTLLRNRDRVRMPNPAAPDDPNQFYESEPPLGLELYFMLIPWHKTPAEEHELLGRVVQLFYGNRSLSPELLSNYLRVQGTTLGIQMLTAEELRLEDQTRLWDSVGRKFRLSASYRVRGVKMEAPSAAARGRVTATAAGFRPES